MSETSVSELSAEETRSILTPFAFKLDKSLFGLPLAMPLRRGVAMAIDLVLVALLSATSSELLAFVIAIVLIRYGTKQYLPAESGGKGRKRRMLLRWLGMLVAFILLLNILSNVLPMLSPPEEDDEVGELDGVASFDAMEMGVEDSIALGLIAYSTIAEIEGSDCASLDCWRDTLKRPVAEIFMTNLPREEATDLAWQFVEATQLNADDQQALIESLLPLNESEAEMVVASRDIAESTDAEGLLTDSQATYSADTEGLPSDAQAASPPSQSSQLESGDADDARSVEFAVNSDGMDVSQTSNDDDENLDVLPEQRSTSYSITQYIRGIIEDLGLGFGWAAFYFTMLTSVWHGQTVGKKLTRIRVVQLNGTPIGLWDSFSRYGGYGAGLATGLLGFLQIYWDPNRQAMHDKISATIVVDLRKTQVALDFATQDASDV